MEAAAPDMYDVHIEPITEGPPRPERQLPKPTLSPCTTEKRWLSDKHGGNSREEYTMVVDDGSGRIWLLGRSIMGALYGEVLGAVEVKIEGDRYVKLSDEEGLTRRFAVKRMPWDKIKENRGKMAEDAENEIAALSIVSNPGHSNVLRLEAALDDGEKVYMLTPFVGGGDMFDWVKKMPCSPGEGRAAVVKPLFRQFMEGIVYIHSKGICHADLSLENMLIDTKGQNLYIIDFGMSLLMPIDEDHRRHMSVADGRKAKTSYCSPETFKRKAYDGVKVDVFAAGAVLFMMLTSKPPFAMPSRIDPRFKKLIWEGDVKGVIRRLGLPPVGDQAVDLLKKMMAYKPEDRPLPEEVLQHSWLAPQVS